MSATRKRAADLQSAGPASDKMSEARSFDDIATEMLAQMCRENLWLAERMLNIGDTVSARKLLASANAQLDQIESHQPPKTTKQLPPITIES